MRQCEIKGPKVSKPCRIRVKRTQFTREETMSHHHFTVIERGKLEALHKLGYSSRKIGGEIHKHHSSVARELHRIKGEYYEAQTAQANYVLKRKNSKPKGKYCDPLGDIIAEKLKSTWSPEQISNTVSLGLVSTKTIYNWLYAGKLPEVDVINLRPKGKRRKKEKRGTFTMGLPISQRPEVVKNRNNFGHWELDTVLSSRGESKGCVATFVERKSRLYTALMIPNKTANSMKLAIKGLFSILPKGSFLTGTTDRGKEFACYDEIGKELGLPLYFADPYAPWQRGSNENSNGLLREFYPKKTDLAKISQKELIHHLFMINSRPRKCLGWKTPIEVFLHELSHLT